MPSTYNTPIKLQYIPLKPGEIRLIALYPGSYDQTLHCKLIHRFQDGSLNYEALSYEWRVPDQPEDAPKIWISDHPEFYVAVPVRSNLFAALREIRDRKFVRHLWIDAISINQDNVEERNEQVKIMNHIYRGASKVLVWVGEAADESDPLFDALNQSSTGTLPQKIRYDQRPFLAFCLRTYWTRVWVIQEIYSALQVEIYCGSKRLEWSRLRQAFDAIYSWLVEVASSGTKTIEDFTWAFQQSPAWYIMDSHQEYPPHSEPPYDIGTLLKLCLKCNSQCADPRDKIYGLKNIARGEYWRLLTPDYTLTISQVYVSIFLNYTDHAVSPSLLPNSLVDAGESIVLLLEEMEAILDNPLWDPTCKTFFPMESIATSEQLEKLNTARCEVWLRSLGTIEQCGSPFEPKASNVPPSTRVKTLFTDHPPPVADEMLASLGERTSYLGLLYTSKPNIRFTFSYNRVYPNAFCCDDIQAQSKRLYAPPWYSNCKEFTTETGFIGLATSEIRKGDRLCAIDKTANKETYGARCPNVYLIIRPDEGILRKFISLKSRLPSATATRKFNLIGRAIILHPKSISLESASEISTPRYVLGACRCSTSVLTWKLRSDSDSFQKFACHMEALVLFLLTR